MEIDSLSRRLSRCSLQILKLYAWEPSFQNQVEEIRHGELIVMKKFAYLTSVSTFIFSCAPALVNDVTTCDSHEVAQSDVSTVLLMFSLPVAVLSGVTGLVCRVCGSEPRQRADSREGFHRHFSFQHPPIPPGHAAPAHRRHGAGTATANPGAVIEHETSFFVFY